ncbi:hypothetical protein IBTHAUMO2_300001 [Nitrosopumilaceae archaeon]|nr:hypothetical protein IBTHAUMO2_300001 [Nitrosopumilaceae archaeon]
MCIRDSPGTAALRRPAPARAGPAIAPPVAYPAAYLALDAARAATPGFGKTL